MENRGGVVSPGPDLSLKLCHSISSVPTWLWVRTALPGMLESCAHIRPQSLHHSRGCQSCGAPAFGFVTLPSPHLFFSDAFVFCLFWAPIFLSGTAVQGTGFLW